MRTGSRDGNSDLDWFRISSLPGPRANSQSPLRIRARDRLSDPRQDGRRQRMKHWSFPENARGATAESLEYLRAHLPIDPNRFGVVHIRAVASPRDTTASSPDLRSSQPGASGPRANVWLRLCARDARVVHVT